MYTIQFRGGPRLWDVSKAKLRWYILHAEQDVEAIYEQATPITGRIRKELAEAMERGELKTVTPAARRFINSRP
jgi:hypothetical protein